MKKTNTGYLIITKDRPDLLIKCLQSINEQTKAPDEIVIVEDISENQYLSPRLLKKICNNISVVRYIKVKLKSYSKSRNVALINTSQKIVVFVDDDVLLPKDFNESVINFFKKFPKSAGFAPMVKSEKKDAYSRFGEYFFQSNYKSNSFSLTQTAPFCCVALNMKYAKKIRFDENTNTGEDIIFLRQLTKLNKHFYYHPHIQVKHLFESNPIRFFIKYFNYGRDLPYLYAVTNQQVLVMDYRPSRKIEYFFLPYFVLNRSATWAKQDVKILKDKSLFIPSLIHNLGLFCGIYLTTIKNWLAVKKI